MSVCKFKPTPSTQRQRVLKADKKALSIHIHLHQTHCDLSIYTLRKYLLSTCVGHCCYWDTVMSNPSMTCTFVEPIVPLVLSCHCESSSHLELPIASFLPSPSLSPQRWSLHFLPHSGYNRENYMSWAQGISTTVFRPLSTRLIFFCLLVHNALK